MKNLPTAEELIDKIDEDFYAKHSYYLSISSPVLFAKTIAIEFAKLHVESCKREIINNVETCIGGDGSPLVSIASILNSYPLENIK